MTRTTQLVPIDEALPQLELALDEERALALVAEAVPQPISKLTIAYVRYKPATSCIVLYRLKSSDRERYAYVRVTSTNREYEPSPDAVLTDPDKRLEVLPMYGDRRIRGLRSKKSPDELQEMLERLTYEDRRASYAPAWGQWTVARYKPERRAVLTGVNADGVPYYLRLYAGKDGERTARIVRSLRNSVTAVYSIGAGLRYSHSFRALLTDRVPGEPLSIASPKEGIAAAARALEELHRCPADSSAAASILVDDSANRAVEGLAAILPKLRPHAQALADDISLRLAVAPASAGLIHGDFDASQVLVEGSEAHLLDFDKARAGDPLEDIASLIARLYGRSEPESYAAVTRTVSDFVEVYENAQGQRIPQHLLSAWIALGLLQMAVEPFRLFEPEWPERCRGLLMLSETALQGGLL